jgi:hypothetical protein
MTTGSRTILSLATVLFLVLSSATRLAAQGFSYRGFMDARGSLFPQNTSNDRRNLVGDVLVRGEAFVKPASSIQFAAGVDARANTYDQVDYSWRFDLRDRRTLRPALSVRRLAATVVRGPATVDIGKQFIRWGKTDIVTPTDRFAPRDFLNVIDSEFLAVTGARAMFQWDAETIDLVWVPWFTPSRIPLLNQRWTAEPPAMEPLRFVDANVPLPKKPQSGVRWGHAGGGYELSLSFFSGFNHLPDIEARLGPLPATIAVSRHYARIRAYGVDVAIPTRWLTIKGETVYSTTSSRTADEYVLYVLQIERQTGEWLIVGGYAGELVTAARSPVTFAPDRGLTRSLVARASYTIDTNRSAAVETAVRQNARGAYVKGEFSQARGQHWRVTAAVALIRGQADDFLGQYRRNSHVTLMLRYSF